MARGKSQPVTVYGVEYRSVNAACKELGVNQSTVQARLKRGVSLEDALSPERDSAVRNGVSVEVGGVLYETVQQACKELDVSYQVVQRRRSRGWTTERAFGLETSRGNSVTVRGTIYPTHTAACAALGIPYQSVMSRLKRYDLSLPRLLALYEFQEGKCAVCEKGISLAGQTTTVDHCHTSGNVRGLLCQGCNTAMIAVDSGLMEKLLRYKATPPMENLS